MGIFVIYYIEHNGVELSMMTRKLEKFVDTLPKMSVATPLKNDNHTSYYEVTMEEFTQKLHRDLEETKLWGYNRQFPGPLFDVKQGEPVDVKWINQLPDNHFLPVDHSIFHDGHDAEVRTVTHLHGMETEPDSDGYPEAWFTKDFQHVGPFFKREIYHYPNHQRGATLWYHDHAMGMTRLNVYAGLIGMYILRDKREESLKLPKGEYEIPLILLDRSFHDDGSLLYPEQPDNASENLPNPSIVPFFQGDTLLVNGKVWPYLEVEPRLYRFRLLNASNGRSYQLYLDSGQTFFQIGSDGGLLRKPVELDRLVLEPAERADLLIDFSNYAGKEIILKNDLGPNPDPEDETFDVMQFKVSLPLSEEDTSIIPKRLSYIPSLKGNRITAHRNLKLTGTTDEYGRPLPLLNGKKWADPVTEKPGLGTTEIWSFINIMGFTHPIHLHLIQFQILDRRPFDLAHYNESGEIKYTGPARPPELNERGYKDTVAAHSGEVTRVIVRFAPYSGQYVWHCHVLEHEDYDMMRPYLIID